MSRPSHSRRSSGESMLSTTTYHSFQEIELFEPPMSSSTSTTSAGTSALSVKPTALDDLEPSPIRRHDSGYESITPRSSKRRASTSSSSNSARPRVRPSPRRSAKSGPVARMPRTSAHSLYLTRSQQSSKYAQQLSTSPVTYFHFPAMPEPEEPPVMLETRQPQPRSVPTSLDYGQRLHAFQPRSGTPTTATFPPIPPQTTHYWTSDQTRRLEYAAIDAASRGVKGWVMRHIVPECFVPKGQRKRHLDFEDDTGSVRRYRLDLDEDDVLCPPAPEKNDKRRSKRWRLWGASTF